MNTDIRLSVRFWDHPKTIKLERRLGLEGVKSLQILWIWTAINMPDGKLIGFDEEDIEIAAKWSGENGKFVSVLLELKWITKKNDVFCINGWEKHNGWASKATERSDKARLSKLAKTNPKIYKKMKANGRTGISKEEYSKLSSADELLNNRSTVVCQSSDHPPKSDKVGIPNSAPICPYEKIATQYCEILTDLPTPHLTNYLKKKIRARWRENKDRQDLTWWEWFFKGVKECDFLMGINDKGFSADLDWLCSSRNISKVLNGRYTNKLKVTKNQKVGKKFVEKMMKNEQI